jgi:hypothetical protein
MRYPILPHFSFLRGKHLSLYSPDYSLDAPSRDLDSLPQLVVSLEGYPKAVAFSQVDSNRVEVI